MEAARGRLTGPFIEVARQKLSTGGLCRLRCPAARGGLRWAATEWGTVLLLILEHTLEDIQVLSSVDDDNV